MRVPDENNGWMDSMDPALAANRRVGVIARARTLSARRGPLLVQLAGLLGEGQQLEPLAPGALLLHDAGAVAALLAGLAAEAVAGLLDALAAGAVVVAAVLTELQEERHGLLSEEVEELEIDTRDCVW